MSKILKIKDISNLSSKLHKNDKSIVLCGGCFDVLHVGHIRFLQKAKSKGDFLFVLLENDKTVKKLKGKERPINSQKDRAEILSSIGFIDYIIMLDEMKTNQDYDDIIKLIKPNIIAVTANDPQLIHNKRQAKLVNAKIIQVISRVKNKSTTHLASLIHKNF